MRWGGHVARIEDMRGSTKVWWGNLRERGHLGNLGVDERIILRWIFVKWDVGVWTGFELAQNRDRWRTLVNAVMNLRVP
jgi:hypothetical protein